jgi:hypothetical protein
MNTVILIDNCIFHSILSRILCVDFLWWPYSKFWLSTDLVYVISKWCYPSPEDLFACFVWGYFSAVVSVLLATAWTVYPSLWFLLSALLWFAGFAQKSTILIICPWEVFLAMCLAIVWVCFHLLFDSW